MTAPGAVAPHDVALPPTRQLDLTDLVVRLLAADAGEVAAAGGGPRPSS
jgi:hypothetical protein